MNYFRLTISCLSLVFVIGCQSTGPWAPDEPKIRKNRLAYYETNHWPYAMDYPLVKVPAQFAAGLPALPCVLVLAPIKLFSSEEPTYDFGLAFIEAERVYMEYPGYALYRLAGYPFHLVQEGSIYSCQYVYDLFTEEEEPAMKEGEKGEEAAKTEEDDAGKAEKRDEGGKEEKAEDAETKDGDEAGKAAVKEEKAEEPKGPVEVKEVGELKETTDKRPAKNAEPSSDPQQ